MERLERVRNHRVVTDEHAIHDDRWRITVLPKCTHDGCATTGAEIHRVLVRLELCRTLQLQNAEPLERGGPSDSTIQFNY